MSDLRSLPSIEKILQTSSAKAIIEQFGRRSAIEAIQSILKNIRHDFPVDQRVPVIDDILERTRNLLSDQLQPTMVPVINATGVIVHTNLGRAPLCSSALEAIKDTAQGYSNLEYDLGGGKRGTRAVHADELLKAITGAEAALVVNNNAAGVLLTLAALSRGRRVIISRTQLVEIGGGFRIPEVLKQSGAKLIEIGTTNRVHLGDYEDALEQPAGAVLRAHSSNFKLTGFTYEPTLREVAALAHRHDTVVIEDLGSGALIDTAKYGLGHEPTVMESIKDGADLVCFSGDKLIGGPQSGIIVGRMNLIQRISKHPLARSVRADKLCLAGLAATLMHYLKGDYEDQIPVWMMVSHRLDNIKERAEAWVKDLGLGDVIVGESTVGGGSLPGETLPTYLLSLDIKKPDEAMMRLRRCTPPVIARIWGDRIVFDPRTVFPGQEPDLLEAIRNLPQY